MPLTVSIPAAEMFGTDHDVIDGSYPMIFLEEKVFTHKNWEPQERSEKTKKEKLANHHILRMH